MSFLEFIDVAVRAAAGTKPDAAWQLDPTDRHELRYWDGDRWTDAVSDGGVQAVDAVDLGQGVEPWNQRWWNDTIGGLRDVTVAHRLGATIPELHAIARHEFEAKKLLKGHPVKDVDVEKIRAALTLMHTPRESLTRDRDRAEQAVFLNALNAELMAAGLAVGLVHCARCGAVVGVSYDDRAVRYRCPARHKFMLDDVRVVPTQDSARVRAELAAEPARKGVRL